MGKKDEFMVKHNIVFNGEILSIEEKEIQKEKLYARIRAKYREDAI